MDGTVKIFTIGFTKKTAEQFFSKLQAAGVRRVIDVRLNNVSQLAGFSKKDDLKYFLRAIADIDYLHVPELSPTQDILDVYKKHKGTWPDYEAAFVKLLESAACRKNCAKRNNGSRLPAVQRRRAAPLPSPSRGGVSSKPLAGCCDRPSSVTVTGPVACRSPDAQDLLPVRSIHPLQSAFLSPPAAILASPPPLPASFWAILSRAINFPWIP